MKPPPKKARSWKKVFLIGGIGCSVLLLVGAVLVGLGVVRVGSFVSSAMDQQKVAQGLQLQVYEFGEALHRRDYDRAYSMVDESTRQEISEEEFAEQFAEYRDYLDESMPFPVDPSMDRSGAGFCDAGDPEEFNEWDMKTHFGPPAGDEMLELQLTTRGRLLEDDEVEAVIVSWDSKVDQRPLEEDDYAWAARNFHRALSRGNYREARRMATSAGELEPLDEDEFMRQVRRVLVRIDEADESRVYGLYPMRHVDVMTVRFLLTGDDGAHFVDYVVDRRHEIYDIGDVRPANPNEEGKEKEEDEGGGGPVRAVD